MPTTNNSPEMDLVSSDQDDGYLTLIPQELKVTSGVNDVEECLICCCPSPAGDVNLESANESQTTLPSSPSASLSSTSSGSTTATSLSSTPLFKTLCCNQPFHLDCLFLWRLRNPTCPHCRNLISKQLSACPCVTDEVIQRVTRLVDGTDIGHGLENDEDNQDDLMESDLDGLDDGDDIVVDGLRGPAMMIQNLMTWLYGCASAARQGLQDDDCDGDSDNELPTSNPDTLPPPDVPTDTSTNAAATTTTNNVIKYISMVDGVRFMGIFILIFFIFIPAIHDYMFVKNDASSTVDSLLTAAL